MPQDQSAQRLAGMHHALEPGAVVAALGVDPARGLTSSEVSQRQRRFGPNRLRQRERKSMAVILLHQVDSFIVWLLAAAAGLSFAFGDLVEALAILCVLALNSAIGFFTELRAARSMEALLRMAEVRTRVRRDGTERMVDARSLVPGDVVILDAGDVVTADLRLIESANIWIDESILTGESAPVAKGIAPVDAQAMPADRTNMAFKGTAITQGTGEGVVVATGMATEIGRISDLAQRAEGEVAPLERRLDRLGHRLVWLTLALAALIIALGVLRGHSLLDMIQTGVALAVAAVPEGLPVVATLSLARGMWRMAQRNAVITRLSSVETLGAVTIILTDKTGTLTENRMTATRYLLAGGDVEIGRGPLDASDPRLAWALRLGALCNNASLGDGSEDGHSGDPLELALLTAAQRAGMRRDDLFATWPELREHAFDPDRKMMATVHCDGEAILVAVKGAPERVVAACTHELTADGPRPLDARAWTDRGAEAAREGLRLLGLAMKHTDDEGADPYCGLTLVGLVCLLDPVRADVPEAIRACRTAGVRVVMMTGDHAETAETIARAADLGDGALTVLEGSAVADLLADDTPEALDKLRRTQVFARVAPDTKLELVSFYQHEGHVVAMTGDGVNDAPALKKADIGIAMGKRGTQVAAEAAAMVLKDDAFATIVSAMRHGRVIFGNIQKFVVYLMSCNVSEVLVVGLAVGGGLPAPLLPLQILFLNLVTDVFPAFALGFGQGGDGVMDQPPRDPRSPIVDRRRWILIGALGAAITAATLGAFAIALFRLGLTPDRSVTVAFLTLALAQLWNVFNMRSPAGSLWTNEVTRNPLVWGALALCAGLVAAAILLPGLSAVLHLPDPGRLGLLVALGMSLLPLAFGQLLLALVGPDWLAPKPLSLPGSDPVSTA